MSIQPLIPDMKAYGDPHYLKLVKKINELVIEANENLQSNLKLRNEFSLENAKLKKEMKELKLLARNLG